MFFLIFFELFYSFSNVNKMDWNCGLIKSGKYKFIYTNNVFVVDHQIKSTLHMNYKTVTKELMLKYSVIHGERKYIFTKANHHLSFKMCLFCARLCTAEYYCWTKTQDNHVTDPKRQIFPGYITLYIEGVTIFHDIF